MSDRGKRAKLDEQAAGGGGFEQFDPELVSSIQKLQEIQDQLEKVNEEAIDKVLEVEQKYNEIRRPVYQKRSEIIQGISDFWLTAFLSHPALSEYLNYEDQQVFKYLQSLDVEEFKDVKSGYSIAFTFRPNPFFEDSKLVKVFRFSDEGTTSISGTQPRWKDGMNLTNGGSSKSNIKHPFQQDSFFSWFSDTLQMGSSIDEIAEIIKDDLWPNPLKYFNNEQGDDDDDDDDDEDEDDEDAEAQENGAEGEGEGEETDNDDEE